MALQRVMDDGRARADGVRLSEYQTVNLIMSVMDSFQAGWVFAPTQIHCDRYEVTINSVLRHLRSNRSELCCRRGDICQAT